MQPVTITGISGHVRRNTHPGQGGDQGNHRLPAFPPVGKRDPAAGYRAPGGRWPALPDSAQRWLRQDEYHRLDGAFADPLAPLGRGAVFPQRHRCD